MCWSHYICVQHFINTALIKAIISSVTDSFDEAEARKLEEATNDVNALTETERSRIERLASALDKTSDDSIERTSHPERTYSRVEGSSHGKETYEDLNMKVGYIFRMTATVPETMLTVVNDLQGKTGRIIKVKFQQMKKDLNIECLLCGLLSLSLEVL